MTPRTCTHEPACTSDPQCGERNNAPSTPYEHLIFDWAWGDLKDHWQDCEDCDGTGKEEADGSGPPDDCPSCDGDGRKRWGSYYHADVGECAFCERDRVHVAEMYEGGGKHGEGWVCLPCYIEHHLDRHPDCELWRKAEAASAAVSAESNSATVNERTQKK